MSSEAAHLNYRRWRDLSTMRLIVGLAISPLLPIAIGSLLLSLPMEMSSLLHLGGIAGVADVWSLAIGTVVLGAVGRARGVIRRSDCILLGIFLAFALPPVAGPLYQMIEEWGMPQAQIEGLHDAGGSPLENSVFGLITGLLLIPFGALGGWMFWRVGVRPAQPMVADVATQFD